LTQTEFAARLNLSAASVSHFETGARVPDPGSTLLLCRAAFKNARIDLADVFANTLPGVAEALLIPCWRSKPSEVAAISTSLKLPQEQTIAVHVSGYQYPPDQPQRSRARRFRDRRSHILEKRSRRKPPPG
jgi:transcriptional regulator with XRE-family HTH domain